MQLEMDDDRKLPVKRIFMGKLRLMKRRVKRLDESIIRKRIRAADEYEENDVYFKTFLVEKILRKNKCFEIEKKIRKNKNTERIKNKYFMKTPHNTSQFIISNFRIGKGNLIESNEEDICIPGGSMKGLILFKNIEEATEDKTAKTNLSEEEGLINDDLSETEEIFVCKNYLNYPDRNPVTNKLELPITILPSINQHDDQKLIYDIKLHQKSEENQNTPTMNIFET